MNSVFFYGVYTRSELLIIILAFINPRTVDRYHELKRFTGFSTTPSENATAETLRLKKIYEITRSLAKIIIGATLSSTTTIF
jgi:hypothetical protein